MTHPGGLEVAIASMKREGISAADIDTMMRKNPARLLGLKWRSTAKWQCDPYRHEHPPAGLVKAPPDSSQPWADAMSHAGDERLRSYFDCCERSSHDNELDEQASSRVDELRQKSSEEKKSLGIGQRGECPLLEQRPA